MMSVMTNRHSELPKMDLRKPSVRKPTRAVGLKLERVSSSAVQNSTTRLQISTFVNANVITSTLLSRTFQYDAKRQKISVILTKHWNMEYTWIHLQLHFRDGDSTNCVAYSSMSGLGLLLHVCLRNRDVCQAYCVRQLLSMRVHDEQKLCIRLIRKNIDRISVISRLESRKHNLVPW